MKLILCENCQDVFKLSTKEERSCECGESTGKYTDELNAWYKGKNAIPIGFANSTLSKAMFYQPAIGKGHEFTAFVIPRECPTFINKTHE